MPLPRKYSKALRGTDHKDFDDPTAIPGDGWKPVRFPVMFTAEVNNVVESG